MRQFLPGAWASYFILEMCPHFVMVGICSVVVGLLRDLGKIKLKEWIENLTKYSSVGRPQAHILLVFVFWHSNHKDQTCNILL